MKGEATKLRLVINMTEYIKGKYSFNPLYFLKSWLLSTPCITVSVPKNSNLL